MKYSTTMMMKMMMVRDTKTIIEMIRKVESDCCDGES